MNKFLCFIIVLFCTVITVNAQKKLEKKWVDANQNYIEFSAGAFKQKFSQYTLEGDYINQNNLLLLYYSKSDSTATYRINELTDSTLVFNNKATTYTFTTKATPITKVAKITEIAKLESKGFSFDNLWRGAIGILLILAIAYLFSSDKKNIPWKLVGFGITAQIVMAIGIIYVPAIQWIFDQVSSAFVTILDFTRAGSTFLLGDKLMDTQSFGFVFIFQILPTVIFFSALTSLFFYLGVLQIIVKGLAWVMTKALKISGAESLAVAGNIFLGQTEAPLMIKAYLERMNKSEIFLVMVGGMATLAGGVLAAYIDLLGSGDELMRLLFAKQLLMASIMAAPGAIVIAKMLVPQTEPIDTSVKVSSDKIGSNFLDAIAVGTTEGLKLAANVGAMLLVFVAFIAMVNGLLGWVGDLTSLNTAIASYTNHKYDSLSLQYILGTIFSPLAYGVGVNWEDASLVGRLLGEKLIASEFIAYNSLNNLKNAGAFVEMKSIVISTFMLSGFANIASIGIQIGGIGSLAPGKRALLSKYGLKAMIGGMLASLLSATLAGILIG
ncbi:nucleoside transporter [Neptunitalea chrysea]|uniref:Nucleoside transporter n=1 Tax=Neptunitalea chrysea TaxID=1647581 RepID=A0A9W6EV41_9FLAO|nr:nucleoside transporter C-terminal domain-containing protein [Neptunitalea chrysea]GLB51083.1 nucleoside transporter [Neptunitalea chrysea]